MIVLASGSPRRTELLGRIGVRHAVDPARIDETPVPGEGPREHAVRLARAKARTVAGRHPGAHVLGADTVVVLAGAMLGKPASARDAEGMLARLSGNEHRVITAVALVRDGETWERVDETLVRFRSLSADLIREYVATGEPLDKAGAYGLQGMGTVLVDGIDGDYFGVIGLPLRLVADLLRECGLGYQFTR